MYVKDMDDEAIEVISNTIEIQKAMIDMELNKIFYREQDVKVEEPLQVIAELANEMRVFCLKMKEELRCRK